MASFRNRSRKLTTAQQYFGLDNSLICRGHGKLHHGNLVWEFEARPTPLCRTYRVRIKYMERKGSPEVYIVDPDPSDLAKSRRIPHVYDQKPARLCLYLPGTGQWSPDLRLVDTIVPWTYLWLFYFEDWLVSDEWKGGGEHPSPEEKRARNERKDRSIIK